ncbi:hypothetical protein SY88_14660 [Clostridiales bacterium PH28_bin88]|nr:hypothetical protein SY88_14660 [Clostridiales bacterium PH28_bin88]
MVVLSLLIFFPGAVLAGPEPPPINSRVAVLIDPGSGEIIYARNETERWAPASLTKIMTMYLAFEDLKKGKLSLQEAVKVSKNAWQTYGSRMYIEVDKEVTVADLLKGVSIVSGNDASVAVAERIGGSVEGFAQRMNQKAQELGMVGTNFVNPHGLPDPQHYTTGMDMAILAREYIKSFPQALEYHSSREFTFNNISQQNRNGLLKYPEIDGLKTGHVSGTYNLIATGKRDGYRLIAVVMGASDEPAREKDAMALLDFGFNNYTAYQVGEAGKNFGRIPVYKGKRKRVNAVLPSDLAATVLRNTEVKVWAELPEYLEAPVAKGQQVAQVVIEAGGEVKRYPLVAEEDVRRGNFLKVFFHSLILKLK